MSVPGRLRANFRYAGGLGASLGALLVTPEESPVTGLNEWPRQRCVRLLLAPSLCKARDQHRRRL